MTDENTALDGRIEGIDLTDGAITPASAHEANPAGMDLEADDEADGARSRGQVAAMVAGAITLAVGVLIGMRWARQRRLDDTTVVVLEEPEAARWRRLVQRGDLPTAA